MIEPARAREIRRLTLAMASALVVVPAALAEVATTATQDAAPRIIRVGPQRAVTSVAWAARNARSGDTIEIDAAEYLNDVAAWPQSDLTIRAPHGRVRMISTGASAEGKAIWVIHGNRVTVENIEFSGARVPDRNGAGIRHEGGRLTVRNCLFEHNEMGLLTWNREDAELVVEASEFRDNAVAGTRRPGDPVGHQIYVGSIARFTLRDSYVHHGAFGHLVKSRARENHLVNNRITDESTGRASYELEFPNGGAAYVVGNIIQQSALTENSQVVSFGAEGYRWPRNELFLVNNLLIDDLPHGGEFLKVYPGADRIVLRNNLLLGNARLLHDPSWETAANFIGQPSDLESVATGDYRLHATSKLVGKAEEPGVANGVSLRPVREYDFPMHSRPMPKVPLSPGAVQSLAP